MTSAFDSFDSSALGARIQSSVDGGGAFGAASGIVTGAAAQFGVKAYSGGGPSFWEIFGTVLVWGALIDRVTDLRGTLTSSGGSYSWAGIPLKTSTSSQTVWEQVDGFTIRRLTRNIASGTTTADNWAFYAFGRIVDGDPSFNTTNPNHLYEAAIRSVSATPADNTFTVSLGSGTVNTVGTVDVPTTAAQLVSDCNASGNADIAKLTYSVPSAPVFIDPGDGVIHGTVDIAAAVVSVNLSVSGAGSGTIEQAPNNLWYQVTRNVTWSA